MEIVRKIFNPINNKKGMAMVYVLIIFLIVSIFASTVILVYGNNLRQARTQESYNEAYYLAYTGIQLAFARIDGSKENDDGSEDLYENLIKDDFSNSDIKEAEINFGNGKIKIVLSQSDEEPYVEDEVKEDGKWIKITSTGTLDSNGLSVTKIMFFNAKDPKKQILK